MQNCNRLLLGGAVAQFDHIIFNLFRGGGGSMDVRNLGIYFIRGGWRYNSEIHND